MALASPKIVPCLWFNTEAEEAARFYCSVFKNSKMGAVSYYPNVGQEIHGKAAGSVLTAEFEIEGVLFTALNGGPLFKFDEAVSFQVWCKDQNEIDYYWDALIAGGGQESQCGWLKDKFGLSWQVAPAIMREILTQPDKAAAARAMNAFMKMKKFDVATVLKAYEGK